MAEKKFKSKLRKKLSDRAKKNESGGRSLSYKTLEGGHKEVGVPQRKSYFDQIKGKVVEASKKQAHKILGGRAGEEAKGLSGIRHPAQLIPAYNKGRSLADIIKALTKK